MKNIGYILFSLVLLIGCNKIFSDETFTFQRTDYNGNEIRTDGYYYKYSTSYDSSIPNRTICFFLFRNGTSVSMGSFESVDLDIVDKEIVERYKWLDKYKSGWGVFEISREQYVEERWSTSTGGGLPVGRVVGIIENDTTIRITKHINVKERKEFPQDYRCHFRQFSPKPDSTVANRWID